MQNFPCAAFTDRCGGETFFAGEAFCSQMTHANITTAAKRQNINATDTISKSTFDFWSFMITAF
jgi:hypothetical protein